MTGLQDTEAGDETRRHGHTVSVPHDQQAGGVYDVAEGEAVSVDGSGNIKQAEEGDVVLGVLHEYPVAGENDTIRQDREAVVAVMGTYKAKVTANVSAGSALGAPDVMNGADAGEFDDSGQTNSSDQGFRAVEVYQDSSNQHWAEVRL